MITWNDSTVFSADEGEPVGGIRHRAHYASFVVTGTTLTLESRAFARRVDGLIKARPRQIRAFDLETGEDRWAEPVGTIAPPF